MARLTKGHQHPIILYLDKAVDYFVSQGYSIAVTAEIETAWYNFDFLRVPEDHPSRDVQDTFWLKNGSLLRTHTSTAQGRVMSDMKIKPPIRIISPGKVYRNEATDASHEAMFYQLDGFVVEKGITMAHLVYTISEFINFMFGKVETKFYPHHYPFVEPGMDVAIRWKGKWLEVLGCGMIHPEVIKNMGLNSSCRGFAFGLGFDRLVMLKTGVNDIRMFYHPDIRLINQF